MTDVKSIKLLVGDNPFHGISHLSQERSRARETEMSNIEHITGLVDTSLDNGADGFMFSVSEITLSILRELSKRRANLNFEAYAIVPYAYEYVRTATQSGGVLGLGKKIAKQIIFSGNLKALTLGAKGIACTDIATLLKTYILYEISRIKSSAGKHLRLNSVLLHEIVTEMALALDMSWLFKAYIDFMQKLKISPGFETRNFAYLVNKFKEWNISFKGLTIATPFNKVGFQMVPSKMECEKALESFSEPVVIAISILAAGYLSPSDAIDYIATLPNIKGVAVGVSKEKHALETFKFLKARFCKQ
jgi:hypothetical protein